MSPRHSIGESIPLPWSVRRVNDGEGWGHVVLSADAKEHDRYQVPREVGASLASLQAVAPEAIDYVYRAAEKGGSEAKAIVARYERLLALLNPQTRPEDAVKMRGQG